MYVHTYMYECTYILDHRLGKTQIMRWQLEPQTTIPSTQKYILHVCT